jgi:hypothetical protein
MSWEVGFNEKRREIYLTFRADISTEDVQESTVAITAMMNDHDAHKILTDFTGAVSLAVSTADIFGLPEAYRTLDPKVFFTEAVVAPKDSKIRRDAEFYETVCVNNSMNVRVFEARDQALEWLSLKTDG